MAHTSLPHSHVSGESCVVFNCPWNYLQGLPPGIDFAVIDAVMAYKVRCIKGGQYNGYYEVTHKSQRIEAGGPFVTRATAMRHMQAARNAERARQEDRRP